MQISRRLMAAASMVTAGCRLADVGTDHAYIPIYLVKEGKIPSSIAMDINKGPILRAQENIRLYGLENRIETRLSDGLEKLSAGEADSVLIAGMGGLLIVRILTDGKAALEGCRELILQPQSEIRSVRAYLEKEGYRIIDEELILEDGKFYPMMHAVYGDDAAKMRDDDMTLRAGVKESEYGSADGQKPGAEHVGSECTAQHELGLRYGPLLLKRKHPLMLPYLAREEELITRVLQSLEGKNTEAADARRRELQEDLELNRRAAQMCGADRERV